MDLYWLGFLSFLEQSNWFYSLEIIEEVLFYFLVNELTVSFFHVLYEIRKTFRRFLKIFLINVFEKVNILYIFHFNDLEFLSILHFDQLKLWKRRKNGLILISDERIN